VKKWVSLKRSKMAVSRNKFLFERIFENRKSKTGSIKQLVSLGGARLLFSRHLFAAVSGHDDSPLTWELQALQMTNDDVTKTMCKARIAIPCGSGTSRNCLGPSAGSPELKRDGLWVYDS